MFCQTKPGTAEIQDRSLVSKKFARNYYQDTDGLLKKKHINTQKFQIKLYKQKEKLRTNSDGTPAAKYMQCREQYNESAAEESSHNLVRAISFGLEGVDPSLQEPLEESKEVRRMPHRENTIVESGDFASIVFVMNQRNQVTYSPKHFSLQISKNDHRAYKALEG